MIFLDSLIQSPDSILTSGEYILIELDELELYSWFLWTTEKISDNT